MQQQHAMSGMARLTDYTRDVEFHYMKERNRWAYLQTQGAYQDLYDLLFLFACGHTTSWRAQGYNADAYDIASEAFIHCGTRLRRYPFDITLDCWLDRHTHQCAAQLYCFNKHSNISLSDDDTSDWLLAPSTQCNDTLRDQLIDLDNGIAKLDKSNRNVLKMWRNGYSLQETSRALKMTEKAVSNRRGRIREKLLKLIDDPYPEKTT
jgi:DNA-directed RNA polymerase specialized sigma24 family protein